MECMSLDPTDVEEEKKDKTKRRIDWGGIVDTYADMEGNVQQDAPNSIGAKVMRALDLLEQAYQTGNVKVFWRACRKQAYSDPLRRIDHRDYARSDTLKELLVWGRRCQSDTRPYLCAAGNGLTKVLGLFPALLERDKVAEEALVFKQAKALEFILQTRKSKISPRWIDDRLSWSTDVECARVLLASTSPDEYQCIHWRFSLFYQVARMACLHGSIPLLKLLIERGYTDSIWGMVESEELVLDPNRLDFLSFVLDLHQHTQVSINYQLLNALERNLSTAVADLYWSHGARIPPSNLAWSTCPSIRSVIRYVQSKSEEEIDWAQVVSWIVYWDCSDAMEKLVVLQDEFGVDVSGLLDQVESHRFGVYPIVRREVAREWKRKLETRIEEESKPKKPRIE